MAYRRGSMNPEEFRVKLAEFLQETVGELWQWEESEFYDEYGLNIKNLSIQGLEPEKEEI